MTHRSSNDFEERQEEGRRFGLAQDPYADFQEELELADRLADQGSLGPGSPAVRAQARYRLGRGPSPYEQAERPPCTEDFGRGERVVHEAPDSARRCGQVVGRLEDDVVVVDFGRAGKTAVGASEPESEAA